MWTRKRVIVAGTLAAAIALFGGSAMALERTHTAPPAVDVEPTAQEPTESPRIEFILPRPIPFRMEYSGPPDPVKYFELSPISVDQRLQDRLRGVLLREFELYPGRTLDPVDRVYVGSTLDHNGRSVGATYMLSMLFIAAGEGDAGEVTDRHLVRAFHHEVSSLLLFEHPTKFDAARFRACLPEGFVYGDEVPGADPERGLAPGEDVPSLELLEQGFLVPWGMRNLEQDFNSYAEVLMQDPDRLLEMFAPASRVGRKARVVRDFYLAIDPGFAKVFEGGRGDGAGEKSEPGR